MTITQGINKKPTRSVKCLLIDLDDTLYRNEEAPHLVRTHIEKFMAEKLGIPKEKVPAVASELYMKYGTTMAGLVASGHKIDYDEYHRFVHHNAIPYDKILHPDILLREILCSIDLPKYILTNADRKHAHICLERMGISDCFQGIYDFEWVMEHAEQSGYLTPSCPVMCKPLPQTYEMVLEHIGADPTEVIFMDDSVRNIAAGHQLGMMTVLVGKTAAEAGADLAIPSMHELPHAMPELFDQPGVVRDVHADMLVSVQA